MTGGMNERTRMWQITTPRVNLLVFNIKHPLISDLSSVKMIVYILISSLVTYRNVEAAPIFVDRADTLASPLQLKRTLFGIIWSCITTLAICTWTSVNPNVPPPNKWEVRFDRLKLTFWMIVAPELVLAWAVRQFFAAREIRDTYNERYPGEYGGAI